MKTGNAFFAGVMGGVAMSLLMTLARARGIPVNTELLLGTFPGGSPGPTEWISGFAVALLLAGVIGGAYAQGFRLLAPRGGRRAAVAFSFVHAIVGGVLLEAVVLIHPLVPHSIPDPGTFLGNFGPAGLFIFFSSHFAYGTVVGTLYEPSRVSGPLRIVNRES
jgi:hypothetical protein